MIITASLVILTMVGFLFFVMGRIDPIMSLYYVDWIGAILMVVPPIGFAIRLKTSQAMQQFDSIARDEAPIEYLRRDNSAIDIKGKRIYSGESFLDVDNLGLIEDLGTGCVFTKGGKKKRFGLENISFTPSPKYMNFTAELYKLGFDSSDDVYAALNPQTENDLVLMGKVYQNMLNDGGRGATKLLKELKEHKPEKVIKFKPVKEDVGSVVDQLLKRNKT